MLEEAADRTELYQEAAWWRRALEAGADVLELAPVPPALRKVKQMKNWKTTASSLAGVLAIAAKILNGGGITSEDIAIIGALVGLLFAKDHDQTGGTKY